MGRFDFLKVSDSDSDSATAPSPREGPHPPVHASAGPAVPSQPAVVPGPHRTVPDQHQGGPTTPPAPALPDPCPPHHPGSEQAAPGHPSAPPHEPTGRTITPTPPAAAALALGRGGGLPSRGAALQGPPRPELQSHPSLPTAELAGGPPSSLVRTPTVSSAGSGAGRKARPHPPRVSDSGPASPHGGGAVAGAGVEPAAGEGLLVGRVGLPDEASAPAHDAGAGEGAHVAGSAEKGSEGGARSSRQGGTESVTASTHSHSDPCTRSTASGSPGGGERRSAEARGLEAASDSAASAVVLVGDRAATDTASTTTAAATAASAAVATAVEAVGGKKAKTKVRCGLFPFCRKKEKQVAPQPRVEGVRGSAAETVSAVAASMDAPLTDRAATSAGATPPLSTRESCGRVGTPHTTSDLLPAPSRSSASTRASESVRLHVQTVVAAQAPASHHSTAGTSLRSLPVSTGADDERAGAAAGAEGERMNRRVRRVRVRRLRDGPRRAAEVAEAPPVEPASSLSGEVAKGSHGTAHSSTYSYSYSQSDSHCDSQSQSQSQSQSHRSSERFESSASAVPSSRAHEEQQPRALLDERARTPTPNDVPFPVPMAAAIHRTSTAEVCSVRSGSPRSSRASDSVAFPTPHSSASGGEHGLVEASHSHLGHVPGSRTSAKAVSRGVEEGFPDTTEAAGLTAEANDLCTDDPGSASSEPSAHAAVPAAGAVTTLTATATAAATAPSAVAAGYGWDADADEILRRLPPYQRRLIKDLREQQRRELEELAKEWPELTFRPVVNRSPQQLIQNQGHFSERLSPSPCSPSRASAEACDAQGTPRRRLYTRGTYRGEPIPSFAPEISAYARSRNMGPETVFERLQKRPAEKAHEPTAEERECSFAPEICSRSKQLGHGQDVFARLTRLPRRNGAVATASTPPSQRRERQGSASPSVQRDGERRESVFERLYRLRKTPTTSPPVSPQRSRAERAEHQPQITRLAHELSTTRSANGEDFGERLHASAGGARDEWSRKQHTPFYPSVPESLRDDAEAMEHHSAEAIRRDPPSRSPSGSESMSNTQESLRQSDARPERHQRSLVASAQF